MSVLKRNGSPKSQLIGMRAKEFDNILSDLPKVASMCVVVVVARTYISNVPDGKTAWFESISCYF